MLYFFNSSILILVTLHDCLLVKDWLVKILDVSIAKVPNGSCILIVVDILLRTNLNLIEDFMLTIIFLLFRLRT